MSGLIVDLFAGGGGASTGIEWAVGRSPDLGINHSWDALRNHALNHPETDHLVDDIRAVCPLAVTRGERVDVLWASPDCRHFSRAKGGKPCHPEIRSLPWEVTRWARETRPRLICVCSATLGSEHEAGAKIVAAFLSTYYGQSVGQPVDQPMATQTTKHRHAVVTVEIDGVTYAIVDIRMRMVKAKELKLAQGFPRAYRLEGTQKLQVALIGNSVPPQLADAVVRANTPVRPRVGTTTKVRIA